MIKRILLGLVAALLLLVAAVIVGTLTTRSRQLPVTPLPVLAVDKEAAAIRARTVSGLLDPAGVAREFEALHAHLRQRYPLLHERLEREVVGEHALLYTWKGSDPAAKPIALAPHQDVVPIAPGTEKLWKHPPFDGVVTGGEASPIASSTSDVYRHVERAIREVFPGAAVAPGLMLAGTDARHFVGLADQIYRFTPVRAGPAELSRPHGTDERLSVDNLAEMIRFHHRLLQLAAGPSSEGKQP